MAAARSDQLLPTITPNLLGPQANSTYPQNNVPGSIQDRINAALSLQRNYPPYQPVGQTLASVAAPDPLLSLALHNALQQQVDALNSNRRSENLAANVNQAMSSIADGTFLLAALSSQLGGTLPNLALPTPLSSTQRLGLSPDLSVASRLQQLLTEMAAGAPNVAGTQANTAHQPNSAAIAAIAALLLQAGEGRGGFSTTSQGTDGSAMSTSTTSSTYDMPRNQAASPSSGLGIPLPILATSQALPLLRDPPLLDGFPTVITMSGNSIPHALLSAPARFPAGGPTLSHALRVPSGPVEERKLPRILHVPSDDDALSPYQCLVRKQIELFEASEADIHATAQGRNRPIVLGQVGIRCIHCGRLPIERRARGAVYFPSTLMSTYQTAQNMANSHLIKDCNEIPKAIREDLIRIRLRENSESQNTRKSAFGGGRSYWARGLQANHGVIETKERRLKFDISSIVG